ncbi:MAG: aldehyde dehydrogenase family protein [Lysobacterales bacterium]
MTATPTLQPILLDGRWQPASEPIDQFRAINPATAAVIEDRSYPVSGWSDLAALLQAGRRAAATMATLSSERIADFLDTYATCLEQRAGALVEAAHIETGLPRKPRLAQVELPRTTGQLRQAAAAVREGSWRRATIDSAANIRSWLAPLGGPVVVIGPNNFPFAFNGVAGGDMAAAIAAGNPVIAKAHPGHPHTSMLLAEAALEAIQATQMPPATVQMFFHTSPELGLRLVSDPDTAAVAFTGSRAAGLALKAAADQAGRPIYLELSSLNPIFVLAGALAERGSAIATELHGSCALGAGQFCTRPGLVVLPPGGPTLSFVAQLQSLTEAATPGTLFTPHSPLAVDAAVQRLRGAGAQVLAGGEMATEVTGFAYRPTLLQVSAERFLLHPQTLQTEAFAHVCLLVRCERDDEFERIAASLEGNLTGTIYSASDGSDDALCDRLATCLRPKVGRLLNDKMPTGVAVSAAMNHGGPYPSTGHPGFTAVGMPAAMTRFAALHCYDNVRQQRLPAALRDASPDGRMWRLIDGQWTRADVGQGGA